MVDLEVLRKFVPFKGLEEKYLEEALRIIRTNTHAKGTMIFKRSKALDVRYFLLEGQVDLIDAAFYANQVISCSERAESALNPETPTRCSALAKSSVTVFSIDAEALDRIVAWSQTMASASDDGEEVDKLVFEVEEINEKGGDWMSSLLQSPLFSRIPLTQVQELFIRFEDVAKGKGDVVIKEGEKGDYFYVLASGSARVYNRSDSVDLILGPGSYFGEEALLGNTVRNATVEMTSSGILKRLTAENFTELLKSPVLRYIEDRVLKSLDKPYKLIDVKMPMEYRLNHVPGSINVPLSRLRSRIPELDASNTVYVVPDDAGGRADIAAHLLCQAGYEALILKSKDAA